MEDNEETFLRPNEGEPLDQETGLPSDLIEELDQALEALTIDMGAETPSGFVLEGVAADGMSVDAGIRQMQETFLEITRKTLAPLHRYMKAISAGESTRELLEISELVVTPLIPRVEAVGLNEHSEDLAFFRSLLLLALGERDQTGSNAMREVVMEGFSKLSLRFGIECRGYRLAVRNLVEFYRALRSSDSLCEMDARKFFGIGVPSLTWVRRSKVSELTSLSGIEPKAIAEIRRLAYQYRSVPPMHSAKLAKEDMFPQAQDVSFTEVERGADTLDVLDSAVLDADEEIVPIRGSA